MYHRLVYDTLRRGIQVMNRHFKEIEKMALAFYLKKPIYVLRDVKESHPYHEEIVGMNSIFLKEKV
ncbi:MAG: hypothetical protein U1C57_03855 [Candidatus Doudnabacteria bacterium]|nr:hypothetical protein [bacterium]MDZ4244211.1 hypothetical protein [Candidatus Doudnabacteria bacterium]